MKEIIQVIGKRWFDKINGNTYHSVNVFINNKLVGNVPFHYGYEEHYKQTAFEILKKNGYFKNKDYVNFTRESNVLFSVSNVSRRKDL